MSHDHPPTSSPSSKKKEVMVYFARKAARSYKSAYGDTPDTIYADFSHWGVESGIIEINSGMLLQHLPNRSLFQDGFMSALGWRDPLSRCWVGQGAPDEWEVLFAEMELFGGSQ